MLYLKGALNESITKLHEPDIQEIIVRLVSNDNIFNTLLNNKDANDDKFSIESLIKGVQDTSRVATDLGKSKGHIPCYNAVQKILSFTYDKKELEPFFSDEVSLKYTPDELANIFLEKMESARNKNNNTTNKN